MPGKSAKNSQSARKIAKIAQHRPQLFATQRAIKARSADDTCIHLIQWEFRVCVYRGKLKNVNRLTGQSVSFRIWFVSKLSDKLAKMAAAENVRFQLLDDSD